MSTLALTHEIHQQNHEIKNGQTSLSPSNIFPTIFHHLMNMPPLEPLIIQLEKWIYNQCNSENTDIKIQAKLGLLLKVIEPSIADLIQIRINAKRHKFIINSHTFANEHKSQQQLQNELPFTQNTNNEHIARISKQYGIKSICILDTSTTSNPFLMAQQMQIQMINNSEMPHLHPPKRLRTVYFDSNISEKVFKYFNRILNGWVANAGLLPNQRNIDLQNVIFPKAVYYRNKEIEKIYSDISNIHVILDIGQKLKQNTNQNENAYDFFGRDLVIKDCIQCRDRNHLDICSPETPFDIQICTSFENTVQLPMNECLSMVKCKDCVSYLFDIFSININCVHTYTEKLDSKFIHYLAHQMRNALPLPMNASDYKQMMDFMDKQMGHVIDNQVKEEIVVDEHGCLLTYEMELEIVNKSYFNEQRELKKRGKNNTFGEIVNHFAKTMISLTQLTSNLEFIPMVCKLSNKPL